MIPAVTIIIPVYNVAPYLRECLESVVGQTYRNIEIILINDGSTDNSVDLCKEYAMRDSRIRLINKSNGGVASARNDGLDIAKGNYVTFVDSDDVIVPNYVGCLLEQATLRNADIVCCNIIQWDPEKNISVPFPGTRNSLSVINMSSDFAIEQMLRNRLISAGPYSKLIRRHVIDKERFAKLVIAEDLEFNTRIFNNAKEIVYCDSDIYKYRQVESGAMRKPFAPLHMDAIKATDLILQYAILHKKGYVKAAEYRLIRAAMYCAGGMIHSGQKHQYRQLYSSCRTIIRHHALSVVIDKSADMRMRTAVAVAAISIPFAWRMMTGWHKVSTRLIGREASES